MVLSHRRRTGNGKIEVDIASRQTGVGDSRRLPTVSAFVVVATVIVAVGVTLTSTGRIFAAIRQRAQGEKALSDQRPEGYVDLNSPSSILE
jgi:hypothetical protein